MQVPRAVVEDQGRRVQASSGGARKPWNFWQRNNNGSNTGKGVKSHPLDKAVHKEDRSLTGQQVAANMVNNK
jgi:hypothetical protein